MADASVAEGLSIGEVSELTGLTAHTIRFYEREGLVVDVRRNAAGRRVFSKDEADWLRVCARLRAAGMPIPDIRSYASATIPERLRILIAHQTRMREQLAQLQDLLRIIDSKVAIYSERAAAGTAQNLWSVNPAGPRKRAEHLPRAVDRSRT
ncbi:MAG TPA: MerR family transcriptional regulator [Pseudonocardia sp.]